MKTEKSTKNRVALDAPGTSERSERSRRPRGFWCGGYDISDDNIERILKNMDTEKLKTILISWRNKAKYYFELEEHESDPVGKKFYNASAMTLKNCIDAIMSDELDQFVLGYVNKKFN